MDIEMQVCQITQCGRKREHNEDRCLFKQLDGDGILVAVADGMGGHLAGEVAAEIAISTFFEYNPLAQPIDAHLAELVQIANERILDQASRDPSHQDMGTTITAALICDGVVHWIHVGDSRLYLFREGELVQVTEDHTLLAILVRAGELSEEEARLHPLRNALLNSLGRNEFEADTGYFTILEDDILILSTDGLFDSVPEEKIASILRCCESPEKRLESLVLAAVRCGGKDDITIILAIPQEPSM